MSVSRHKKPNRAQRRKTALQEAIEAAKGQAFRQGCDHVWNHVTQFLHPNDQKYVDLNKVAATMVDTPYIRVRDPKPFSPKLLKADEIPARDFLEEVHEFRCKSMVCDLPNGTMVRWFAWELYR